MANDDFGKVLSNVLVELASSDKSRQAAASAAAAVLLAQAPEGVTLSLSVVPAVLPLLNSDSQLLQVFRAAFEQQDTTRQPLNGTCAAEKCLCGTDSRCRSRGSNTSSRTAPMGPSGM